MQGAESSSIHDGRLLLSSVFKSSVHCSSLFASNFSQKSVDFCNASSRAEILEISPSVGEGERGRLFGIHGLQSFL